MHSNAIRRLTISQGKPMSTAASSDGCRNLRHVKKSRIFCGFQVSGENRIVKQLCFWFGVPANVSFAPIELKKSPGGGDK
jgi:hypothetical protein